MHSMSAAENSSKPMQVASDIFVGIGVLILILWNFAVLSLLGIGISLGETGIVPLLMTLSVLSLIAAVIFAFRKQGKWAVLSLMLPTAFLVISGLFT